VTNQVDFLLTWNCTHLANAARQELIVEEVRRARDAYAKDFHYDLDAIYRDLKAKACQSQQRVVTCPPNRQKAPEQQVGVKPV